MNQRGEELIHKKNKKTEGRIFEMIPKLCKSRIMTNDCKLKQIQRFGKRIIRKKKYIKYKIKIGIPYSIHFFF